MHMQQLHLRCDEVHMPQFSWLDIQKCLAFVRLIKRMDIRYVIAEH